MKKSKLIGLFILFIASSSNDAQSQQLTKISDLVYIQNAEPIDLIGYGLVTGLERTGDRVTSGQSANFTVQSISNMLENFGINVDPSGLRTRNVAAVMVRNSEEDIFNLWHVPNLIQLHVMVVL